ncbi:MAG TPA: hypothetical protein PKJ41_12165 [Bryobacteraceae bacterium]|nr:hypothetical protein [Bryobacteraceae bacterium]
MKKISRRQTLAIAATLPAIASTGAGRLLAQSRDTPIIISDGSLKMRSGVPWARFAREGARRRIHPSAGKRITTVEVRLAGDNNTTVNFNAQQCEVTLTYASIDIVLATGPRGGGLRIDTDWASFRDGSTENELEHSNQESKISRVIVKRDDVTVIDQSPNGGTQIILRYED